MPNTDTELLNALASVIKKTEALKSNINSTVKVLKENDFLPMNPDLL